MKRAIFLATAALMVMLILAPVALAQDTVMQTTAAPTATTAAPQTITQGTTGPLPTSGGPAILLPAAALLLGSGILTYAVLRRR